MRQTSGIAPGLYAAFIRATVLPYGSLTAPRPILFIDANDLCAACPGLAPQGRAAMGGRVPL